MTELSGAMPGLASEGGAMPVSRNLFAGLPGKAAAEVVETLVRSPAVRIERIHRLDRAGEPAGVLVRPAPGRVDRGARRLRRAPRRGRGRAAHAPGRRPRPLAGPLPPSCRMDRRRPPDGLARRAFRGVSAPLRAEAPGCASAQREAASWFLSPALPRTSSVAAGAGDELASQTVVRRPERCGHDGSHALRRWR